MTTLQIKIQKKAKKIQKAEVCLERCKFSCCNIAALQVQICGYMDTIQWISIYISIYLYKDMDYCCYNSQLHKCETAANFKLIALIALQ